jgi:LuxR family maltose regulon positive regulatory protein
MLASPERCRFFSLKITCLFMPSLLYSGMLGKGGVLGKHTIWEKDRMPKRTPYTLTWSSETNMYELALRGKSFQQFCVEDEHSWSNWLAAHTSFLFQGRTGSLRAYQESRPRGGDYWYAYHFTNQRLRKRYLGRNSTLSFARLEEIAGILTSEDRLSAQSTESHIAASAEKSTSLPLLHSRHQVPHVPRALVERPRLLKLLDAALAHPLTLVSASAGWGKTTLLSVWAARSAVPIAWLSLDELDNDATRFWLSVLSALRNCLPDVGEMALLMLRSPQPPPLPTIVATLLNELNGLDAPTLLLLDDYHLICEQTIHDSLLFLLEHLPPHLNLVLSSRIDPPLALSRFRARGQLLELRDADLRFEGEETTRFLTHTMSISLSQAEIAELARRTGGLDCWPATGGTLPSASPGSGSFCAGL